MSTSGDYSWLMASARVLRGGMPWSFLTSCAALDWDRVNFLPSSWYELWFGFVLDTVLITQACFSYWAGLTQGQGLSCSSPHRWSSWGFTRSCRDIAGDPTDPRDIPGHPASFSHKKLGKKEEGSDIDVILLWWSLAVLGMAEHLPTLGKWEMNSSFCFACVCGFCFTN